MGLVSYRDEDRLVTRQWFETVLKGASCRSSVPPVWEVLQSLWDWVDKYLIEVDYKEDQPIGERQQWWEVLVQRLVETGGMMTLV